MTDSNLKERSFKVLIAEDNDINLLLMRTMFASLFPKATLIEAKNGEIAVENLHLAPDIILMDLHMPIMDGFEATTLIRQFPNMEKTPVIALTASNTESEKQACLNCGMDDVLVKPVNKATLEAYISKYLPE